MSLVVGRWTPPRGLDERRNRREDGVAGGELLVGNGSQGVLVNTKIKS